MKWNKFDDDDVKPPRHIRLLIGIKHSSGWRYCECYFTGSELVKCGTGDSIDTIFNVVYWTIPTPPPEED
jgi:hypothetical protein